MELPEFLDCRGQIDAAVPKWLRQGKKDTGFGSPCFTCAYGFCCAQEIHIYPPEVRIIAKLIAGKEVSEYRYLRDRIESWCVRYFSLPPEEQVPRRVKFIENKMFCPLFIGRKCAIYDERPIVCRVHYVFGNKGNELCGQFGVKNPKLTHFIGQGALHAQLQSHPGMKQMMMPLALLAVLKANSPNAKKAIEVLEQHGVLMKVRG